MKSFAVTGGTILVTDWPLNPFEDNLAADLAQVNADDLDKGKEVTLS